MFIFHIVIISHTFQEHALAKSDSNSEPKLISGINLDDHTSRTLFRSPNWAVPLYKPGLPNLHKVSDDLYRGAQPKARGFRELKTMGIKTVVNLRSYHSDQSQLRKTGLDYISIRTHAWRLEEEDIVRFLKIVTDNNRTPVFVHCQHGADRTGAFCAIYRMAVCGWSREEAISEMINGGFGYHKVWQNLIHFLKTLDIEKIKKKAEL